MYKKLFLSTIFLLMLLVLLVPAKADAGLVPCGRDCVEWEASQCLEQNEKGFCIKKTPRKCKVAGEGILLKEAHPCNLCHGAALLQRLLTGIGFLVLGWAGLYIVIGAISMMTAAGSPEKVSKGKKMITYALLGVVIAFAAWFIINEIMIFATGYGTDEEAEQKLPWPWHQIECATTGGGEPPEPPGPDTKYCVCQEGILNNAHTIVKVTELADAQACAQECNSGNGSTYCNMVGPDNEFSCLSEEAILGMQTKCLKFTYTYTRVGSRCYSIPMDCIADINRTSGYPSCADGDCVCYRGIDFPGSDFPCQLSEDAIFIPQINEGYGVGFCGDVFSCLQRQKQDVSGDECVYCAVGTVGCGEEEEEWCQRTAPDGSEDWVLNFPPGGAKPEQKGDASTRLTDFINCMYGKISNLRINSISANALCDDPGCDITQSGICGHVSNSCHFGGTECLGESYAVDFDTSVQCSDIKTAASSCDSSAWVNWEGNHTHISVNRSACGCNELGPENQCP